MLLLLSITFAAEPNPAVDVRDALDQAQKLLLRAQIDERPCIEPKISLLQTLARVSTQSEEVRNRALAAGDTLHADAELRKLEVARSKALAFLQEAEACVALRLAPVSTNQLIPDQNLAQDLGVGPGDPEWGVIPSYSPS